MPKKISFVFLLLLIGFPTQISASVGSLYGRVIILDAGHGIGARGGGVVFSAGYVEHERMFLLAGFIQSELENRGATVHMTRNCRMDIPLPVRPAMMNRWSLEALLGDRINRLKMENNSIQERFMLTIEINRLITSLDLLDRVIYNHEYYAPIYLNYPFDYSFSTQIHPSWRRILEFQSDPLIRYNWLAISLHSNASSNIWAHGADVFFSANHNPRNVYYFDNYSHQDITAIFGRMLLNGIARVGIRANGVRVHHFMLIRETNIPAVLAENGYHTNYYDRKLLQDDNFMQRLAVVYADTIEAYFNRINQDRYLNYETRHVTMDTIARLMHYNTVRLQARLFLGSRISPDIYHFCNWPHYE